MTLPAALNTPAASTPADGATDAIARPAPVADWVTIAELYADPFPTFERLRAEGGVHWVPAVGRYLITSYAAVHDTELDQETFSANEQNSLMIRAMGHSMLRKDDPAHHLERRAWQPVLKPAVVRRTWLPVFERNAERYLAEFAAKGPGADLVWDFAAPFAAENLRAMTGLHNATQQDLQRWSQTMIDATGNYADDPEVWARGEASFDEVDAALDEMLVWHRRHPDDSLLSALLALPDYQMPLESIRANLKMTIGGGLNEPRDAIGVAAGALLSDPDQRALVEADPTLWDAVFEEGIRWVAPIGMYSRQTTREVTLQNVHLPAGARLGICLLSANRDETQWRNPERFDLTRTGEGAHLAFGKGVHVCLGAWAARAEIADVGLPRLFSALPGLRLDPERPPVAGGWVFRGITSMPVLWDTVPTAAPRPTGAGAEAPAATAAPSAATATAPAPPAPTVAIVGSGPAGCFTAQALRKRFPDAELTVIDRLPTPYGLVRHGVAADHQGTKAVSDQFARLFEDEGVRFLGSTRVGPGPAAPSGPGPAAPSGPGPAAPSGPAPVTPPATEAAAPSAGMDAAAPSGWQVGESDAPELTLAQLREAFDVVVLATGLHRDATLDIPGAAGLARTGGGLHGAGRITRLLNAHPEEARPAPSLGERTVVVGHGNVAMDLARLLAKNTEQLADSDVCDRSHGELAGRLHTVHLVGRSLPASAKFDPVMLREVMDLPGVEHVAHGVSAEQLAAVGDPRSALVAELVGRGAGGSGGGSGGGTDTGASGTDGSDAAGTEATRLRMHWWFGYGPQQVLGGDAVTGLEIGAGDSAERTVLDADSIITAIGFGPDDGGQLAAVDDAARATGRITPGLYVAGWARRGPRGTIPSQRSDARELAEVIGADVAAARDATAGDLAGGDMAAGGGAGRPASGRPGVHAVLASVPRATGYDGWLMIDEHESRSAADGRVRTKLSDARDLRLLASSATSLPASSKSAGDRAGVGSGGPGGGPAPTTPLAIAYATESGNAELVAEHVAAHLAHRFQVRLLDLGAAGPPDLETSVPTLVICSTYGDGELPTAARRFHAALVDDRPGLGGLRYAVFGLGDHSYASTYSRGSEILDAALTGCGAQRVGEYGRHDAAGREGAAEIALTWADTVVTELAPTTAAS